LSQRPEFTEHPHKGQAPERFEPANSFFSNHDYQHLSHHLNSKSRHDSHDEVHKGHLPHLDLTGDHHHHHQPAAAHHRADNSLAHNHPAGATEPAKADRADKISPASRSETKDNGMVKFTGLHGAAVDTDGAGAKRHKEDRTRQNRTSLTDGQGHSLDTDKDNFVALPKSEMKAHGIKLGDHGYLERADTGEKVPVVFGDVSSGKQWHHGKGQPEASVAALKALGFNNVNGARGVDKSVSFNLSMAPNSRSDIESASR
jgi:hypothetical protein